MNDNGNGNGETRWYKSLAQPRYIIGFVVAIAAVTAALVPVGLWLADSRESWRFKQLEIYEGLLLGMDGITCQPGSEEHSRARREMSRQLRLCWLYCSDTVIEQGYALLERSENDMEYTLPEQNKALLDIMKTVRMETFLEGTDLSDDIADTFEICENE